MMIVWLRATSDPLNGVVCLTPSIENDTPGGCESMAMVKVGGGGIVASWKATTDTVTKEATTRRTGTSRDGPRPGEGASAIGRISLDRGAPGDAIVSAVWEWRREYISLRAGLGWLWLGLRPPQRLLSPHAFSRCPRSRVKGSPLDVPLLRRGHALGRRRALPTVRRIGCGSPGPRVPLPRGRSPSVAAERRGASDVPGRRVRPALGLALVARSRSGSASGAHLRPRPPRDARPGDPRGRSGPRPDRRSRPDPQGIPDPRARAPGAHSHARLAHGPMVGGDGVPVRPGFPGPSIGPRLGGSAALCRVHRQGEAWTASRRGPATTVGPRHCGRGASAQEPPQCELAVRREPLEKVHAPPDRDASPE